MARLKTLQPRLKTIGSRIATVQPGSWRTDKQTSAQRGYGYKWQQARAQHLAANPLCIRCEAEGRITVATVVDHRIPHRGDMGLFWDRSNWDSLCATHHSRDKQREEAQSI
jgi:5-methylcytosine-specific restriction enzyme A